MMMRSLDGDAIIGQGGQGCGGFVIPRKVYAADIQRYFEYVVKLGAISSFNVQREQPSDIQMLYAVS